MYLLLICLISLYHKHFVCKLTYFASSYKIDFTTFRYIGKGSGSSSGSVSNTSYSTVTNGPSVTFTLSSTRYVKILASLYVQAQNGSATDITMRVFDGTSARTGEAVKTTTATFQGGTPVAFGYAQLSAGTYTLVIQTKSSSGAYSYNTNANSFIDVEVLN